MPTSKKTIIELTKRLSQDTNGRTGAAARPTGLFMALQRFQAPQSNGDVEDKILKIIDKLIDDLDQIPRRTTKNNTGETLVYEDFFAVYEEAFGKLAQERGFTDTNHLAALLQSFDAEATKQGKRTVMLEAMLGDGAGAIINRMKQDLPDKFMNPVDALTEFAQKSDTRNEMAHSKNNAEDLFPRNPEIAAALETLIAAIKDFSYGPAVANRILNEKERMGDIHSAFETLLRAPGKIADLLKHDELNPGISEAELKQFHGLVATATPDAKHAAKTRPT